MKRFSTVYMQAVRPPWILLLCLMASAVGAGCGPGEPPDLGPPAGWEGSGMRWWQAGVDTSQAFRDLETLETMAVMSRETYLAERTMARQGIVAEGQVRNAVKRSVIELYRNEPQLVDSIFEQYVTPRLQEDPLQGDLSEYLNKYKRESYEQIRKHFREPYVETRFNEDVPLTFPDSLRGSGLSGRVEMQVTLNADGEPLAIELLDGVHPVVDAITMQAMTRMRWQPAYLRRTGSWREVPSWTRFNARISL